MKIALYHTTLPAPDRKVGGVEVVVHQLANHLVEADHDVTVFSLSPCPEDALYSHEQLFRSWPSLLGSPLSRMFVLPVLLNWISFQQFDVVHFHGDDWFYLRRTIPSVRTLHGSALEEARTATSWKRRAAQYLLYPLERLASRLASVTLTVGPKTTQWYPNATLINNGVDLSLFHPGEKSSAPRILFVGTWEGRKRGSFLFDRFVHEVLPSVPDATLVMVSDEVSTACAEHPNVEFWARPSDAELAELYRKAWVFASPSVYEGFGLPYIEAMASGTAVLTSPNDGAQYVLDGGKYGHIVSDDEFGASLVTLLQDSQARSRLVQNGLERAKAFSWSVVTQSHLDLYQSVLSPTDSSSPTQSVPSPYEATRS